MKKILKLLFVLSGTTTLPLTVIACGQESLDSNLNIIRTADNKFNIDDLLGIDIIDGKDLKYFSLSRDKSNELAKTIANQILSESEIEITWIDDTSTENEKLYAFKINNGDDGEDEEENQADEDELTWKVDAVTGRFSIQMSYQVGKINKNNEFVAHQQINKSFEIKTYISESDKILEAWISEFNAKNWNESNPIAVVLKDTEDEEIELPKDNTSWSDLDVKIIQAVNIVIENEFGKFKIQNVAWSIQSTQDTVINQKLKLQIKANKGEAQEITNEFFILFTK